MRERISTGGLIKEVAQRQGMKQKEVKRVLEGILQVLKDTLKEDKDVFFVGFGTFRVLERKERKGRNPRTGEVMSIPARKVIVFRPAKELLLGIRNGKR